MYFALGFGHSDQGFHSNYSSGRRGLEFVGAEHDLAMQLLWRNGNLAVVMSLEACEP